ncbi:MAG TPA: hypothetical protein DEP60_00480 [Ruminococcaceae bacterium]|jgi:bacteriocin-associated integral membrane protein|nr:hypothetical protein [Oscillospiraceae bacterium]
MKKLVYVVLVISVIFQAFLSVLLESNQEADKLERDEKIYCTEFAIPDDKAISDPEKLFSALLQTAEEMHTNLFRTYMKKDDSLKGKDGDIEVIKYVLLTGKSRYYQTFELKSGKALTPGETRNRNSKSFLSTQDSKEPEQIGKLYGHIYHVGLSIHPFYQTFSALKTSGRYSAELPAGLSKEAFLQSLRRNLIKEFNKEFPVKSLEGDSQYNSIPWVDDTLYKSIYCILLVMMAALLLYSLFRESKQIAVLKLNGTPNGTILRLLFKNILLVFGAALLSVALAIGIYTKEWPYVWLVLRNSVGMYLITLALLLAIVAGDIRICSVYENLNGKAASKNVFCLNMAVKALSILLVLYVGQSVYTNMKDYQKNMALYEAWGDAGSYGIFDTYSSGSTVTPEDMIQAEGKIAKDVYPVVNRQGALFIKAFNFQPENISQPSVRRYPSITVNPNYLKKYPLLDSTGKQVIIPESKTDWILLAPEHYKSQETSLIKYFQTSRDGRNEIDRQEYGSSAKGSKGRHIKVIWIKDRQKVYSFNSKVSPDTMGALENVLVQVMTEQNSCISDRECVNGNADSDALKVKLRGTEQETYDALLPTLKKAGVAENLTRLVALNQYMTEKAAVAKNEMNLSLMVTLMLTAILLLTVVQNMMILFDHNKKDIIIKKMFGWPWNRRFGKCIAISMSISVVMLGTYWILSFINNSEQQKHLAENSFLTEYLSVSSLLLLAAEAAVSFITILHTENHKTVDTLKGN